ncbi:MAG: putative Ig domain-containing protein, partial [Gemmatimonadaceae bacterium]
AVQSSVRLDAIVKDASGATIPAKGIVWSSDNTAVASAIDGGSNASVTGLSSGMAKVTAQINSLTASALVAVTSAGSGTVGPGGGTVTTSGGEIKVDVPGGATGGHTTDVCIVPNNGPTVSPVEVPGTGFEVRTTSAISRAIITIRYSPSALPAGVDESTLGLFAQIDTTWTALDSTKVDPVNRIIKGETTIPFTAATTTCKSQPASTVRIGGLVIKFTIQSASASPLRVGESKAVTALLSHAASSVPNLTWKSADDRVLKVTPSNASTTGGGASLLGISVGVTDITSQVKARIGGLVVSIRSNPLSTSVLNNPLLSVTSIGGGSGTITSSPSGINCMVTNGVVQPGPCAVRFPFGIAVSLAAMPSAGTRFDGWSGDCTDPATCVVTMSADRAAAAALALPVQISSSASLQTATQGANYSQQLQVTGGVGNYAWSLISGSLPPGLLLRSSGIIEGMPTLSGTYPFKVRALSGTLADTAALQLAVAAPALPPVMISAPSALPNGTQGVPYNYQLTATGGSGNYSWSILSGSLPTGVTLSASGLLSGAPSNYGTFNATLQATSGSQSVSKALQFVIAPPVLTVTSIPQLPNATQGLAYSQQLQAGGGTGSYSWSLAAGAWPAGITMSPSGAMAGTPTTFGSFTVTVQVTSGAQVATKVLQLSVAPPVLAIVSPSSLPNGDQGTAYSQQLSATGGSGNYAWAISSGSLPPGVTLSAAGALAGTPTIDGTYAFVAQVSSGGQTATKNLSLTIAPRPLVISTSSQLPSATQDAAYSFVLSATGGRGKYVWSISGGNVPNGLSLSIAGDLSGTPTVAGSFAFTVQVTSGTQVTSTSLQLSVAGAAVAPSYLSYVNACPAVIQPISLGGGSTIQVRAIDAQTGFGVAGALVRFSSSDPTSQFGLPRLITDAQGFGSSSFTTDASPFSFVRITASISNNAGKVAAIDSVMVVDKGGRTKGFVEVSGNGQGIPAGGSSRPFVVNVGGVRAGFPVGWELQIGKSITRCVVGFTDANGNAAFVIPPAYTTTSGVSGTLTAYTPGEGRVSFRFGIK